MPSADFDSADSVTYYVVVTNSYGTGAKGEASVTVTKTDAVITGIEITTNPSTMSYTNNGGEITISTSGMVVTATWSDGDTSVLLDSEYTVSPSTITWADRDDDGNVTITVTANGTSATDTFEVALTARTPTVSIGGGNTQNFSIASGSFRASVTIDNGGTLTSAAVTDATDNDSTNGTAATTDLTVSLTNGQLNISTAEGVTLDATDEYEITINYTDEAGDAGTATLTLTVAA